MSHVRTQIRNALAAALVGLTTTGARVHVSRMSPFAPEELPALNIHVREEAERTRQFPGQTVPARMRIVATVEIVAYAMAIDGVEATIDTIDAEVMARLHASREAATLGGLVPQGIQPLSYDGTISEEGEQPMMQGRFVWQAVYYIETNAPDVAI